MQMDLLRITVLSNHESGAGQIKVHRVEIMGVATRGTSKCEQALPTFESEWRRLDQSQHAHVGNA